MYTFPKYIATSGIDDRDLDFEWDDWRPRCAYGEGSDEVMEALAPTTLRAKIAAAVGIYEWIVYRFNCLSDDPLPRQFAEAAWCSNVSHQYLNYVELDRKAWRGPIRGPLYSARTILNDMIHHYQEDVEPAINVAFLSSLAIHVLQDSNIFRLWRDACVTRLVGLYQEPDTDPFENLFVEDTGGPLVPREVLDPEFEFRVELTNSLIDRFFQDVDHQSNPFLQAPEVMKAEGFEGTPYLL